MSIGRDEVKHIAGLARLYLDEQEIGHYQSQLGQILDYVEQLKQLDTAGVQPLGHVLDVEDVVRSDQEKELLTLKQIFQNAPEQDENFFKVPQILQGEKT